MTNRSLSTFAAHTNRQGALCLDGSGPASAPAVRRTTPLSALHSLEGGRSEPSYEVVQQIFDCIVALPPVPVVDRAGGVPDPDHPEITRIPLQDGTFALIDTEDYPLVRRYSWRIGAGKPRDARVMAKCEFHGRRLTYYLHRIVLMLGEGSDLIGDHRLHDVRDNRKSELRTCSQAQSSMNRRTAMPSTGAKNVHKQGSKWRVMVQANGQTEIHRFDTFAEAEAFAPELRERLHGEFACHDHNGGRANG